MLNTNTKIINLGGWFNATVSEECSAETDLWNDGIWYHGIWLHGIWLKGIWFDGTWENGVWYSGGWDNGKWIRGYWLNGKWNKGYIHHVDKKDALAIWSPKCHGKPNNSMALNHAKYI